MPKTFHPDKRAASRSRRVRSASELLGTGATHNDAQLAVAQGAAGLAASRTWVCERLPGTLVPHVLGALERNGELTVFTESAVWAARLKLALDEARPLLAPRLAPDAKLKVRVVPGGRYRR